MPTPDAGTPPPFTPGSVSLRLYPHNELPAGGIVSELCAQAGRALAGGFDGIMSSEHHGGFAGYLSTPLQMATFVLEEHLTGWAAACPLLLPRRPTAPVAEEVAWLQARHPGRVGLGVAIGALPLDFEVTGVPQDGAVGVFKAELPRLVAMLRGEQLGSLGDDPALRGCAANPVPVLSAAVSVAAATRAARSGAGLLMEGMSAAERLTALSASHQDAGGTGTRMLIRRVWLGDLPTGLIEQQRRVYDRYSRATSAFGDDRTVGADNPDEMVERLADVVDRSGADALNLRVHLPGMAAEDVHRQIDLLATEVVGPLRLALGGVAVGP